MRDYIAYCKYGKYKSIFPDDLSVLNHLFCVVGNGINFVDFESEFTLKGYKFINKAIPTDIDNLYPYTDYAPVFRLDKSIKRKSLRREFSYALNYLIKCIEAQNEDSYKSYVNRNYIFPQMYIDKYDPSWKDHINELKEISNKLAGD